MMKSGKLILRFLCIICVLQVILTAYLILKVYVSNVYRPDQLKEKYYQYQEYLPEGYTIQDYIIQKDLNAKKEEEFSLKNERGLLKAHNLKVVEIWGVAAIGSYLWEHILGGEKFVDSENPSIYSGFLEFSKLILKYKSGPGLKLEKITLDIDLLVLVLNGRTKEKVLESISWINNVLNYTYTPKVVVVILGNEKCDNGWIKQYVVPNGPIYGAFITYDDPTIDEKVIFQWPLGVATYRNFPLLEMHNVNVSNERKYFCNLQATNHENSDRNELFAIIKNSSLGQKFCHIKERKEWKPLESSASSREYLDILLQSDLTLCPAGFNTETYRVFEALSAGSLPIIENVPSKGSCDSAVGWRLLKEYKPPVLWINDWRTLPTILEKESKLQHLDKVKRRKKLLNWYEWFKLKIRDKFLDFLYKVLRET